MASEQQEWENDMQEQQDRERERHESVHHELAADRWLIVGSGPSADRDSVAEAFAHAGVTVACNAAIGLAPWWTYCVVMDPNAVRKHDDIIRDAAAAGALIVGRHRPLPEHVRRWARLTNAAHRPLYYHPLTSIAIDERAFLPHRYTGLFAIEWAAKMGARSIELLGMENSVEEATFWEMDLPAVSMLWNLGRVA